MKKILAVAGCAALFAGCASSPTGQAQLVHVSTLQGKSVAVTQQPGPMFTVLTPTKAVLLSGLIGGLIMANQASGTDRLVDHFNIPDPAVAVSKELSAALVAQGVTVYANPVMATTSDPKQLAEAVGGRADYILDVTTIFWNMQYQPTAWNSYSVIHNANAQLIDARSGKVVASGQCRFDTKTEPNLPTYDQMVADKGALMRKRYADGSAQCVAHLKQNMLKA